MKKMIELLRTLEGHTDSETMTKLITGIRLDILETAQNIHHNNSTRKAALSSYIKSIPDRLQEKQDTENGLYIDGVTAVSVRTPGARYDENNDTVKMFLSILKDRKPADMRDSLDYPIAEAKENGWRLGDTDHYITVNGEKYNLSLVARIYNIIADPKSEYNGVRWEIESGDDRKHHALILTSKHGIGVVLPFNSSTARMYDVTPGASDLDEIQKRISEAAWNEAEKTA